MAVNAVSGRTMKLCKFPEEARYAGGPVDAASSWACRSDDRRLLEIGPDGAIPGADAEYEPGGR